MRDLFVPQTLVGRQRELRQVVQVLQEDGDLLLAGVPGSGRHTLIQTAARQVGAKVLELDCLRATNSNRFLELLAEGFLNTFSAPAELAFIQRWLVGRPLILERAFARRARLVWHTQTSETWDVLQVLLSLPQALAEWLDCRVVLVFENFPHIRSWDRTGQWETYVQQEIQQQSRVSYALITTVAEDWAASLKLNVITLGPLTTDELLPWVSQQMMALGLVFADDRHVHDLFTSYVQGNMGAAIALARRIWLDHRALDSLQESQLASNSELPDSPPDEPVSVIQAHHIHRSALALVEDLSTTFESLILLLPPTQVRVLESLALDPTDSPHSREYIQKHQLSRGGGLQGALAGLEHKGLVYGPQYGYQIALPFLAFWLKHRLA
jgi:hypothetical protein